MKLLGHLHPAALRPSHPNASPVAMAATQSCAANEVPHPWHQRTTAKNRCCRWRRWRPNRQSRNCQSPNRQSPNRQNPTPWWDGTPTLQVLINQPTRVMMRRRVERVPTRVPALSQVRCIVGGRAPRLQRNRFARLGHGGSGAGASLRRHIVDGGAAPSGTNGPHGIVVETKNKSIWLFEGACRRLANVSSWGRSGPDPGAPFGRPGIRTSKTDGTKMCDAFNLFLGVRLRWHSAEWYKCHLLSSAGARRRLKQT